MRLPWQLDGSSNCYCYHRAISSFKTSLAIAGRLILNLAVVLSPGKSRLQGILCKYRSLCCSLSLVSGFRPTEGWAGFADTLTFMCTMVLSLSADTRRMVRPALFVPCRSSLALPTSTEFSCPDIAGGRRQGPALNRDPLHLELGSSWNCPLTFGNLQVDHDIFASC